MERTIGTAITLLRKAIALYYPSLLQPGADEDTKAGKEYTKNPIEQGFKLAYEATARFDPDPDHYLGFTIDHAQNTGKAFAILHEMKELEKNLAHVNTMTAAQKAENWMALEQFPLRDDVPYPTLAVGTVVRAVKKLDDGITDIEKGTLGYVFGEANCYGDGAGPIVQWITIEQRLITEDDPDETTSQYTAAERVCNVYIGDIEIVRVHSTVDVVHW